MGKIVQIKYAYRLQYAKNKICLILGVDKDRTVILAHTSSLNWRITKDLLSHLTIKCNFTFRELQKLNLFSGRYLEPYDIIYHIKYRIWIS